MNYNDGQSDFYSKMLVWLVVIVLGTAFVTWLYVQPHDYRVQVLNSVTNGVSLLAVFGIAQPGVIIGSKIIAKAFNAEQKERGSSVRNGLLVIILLGIAPAMLLAAVLPYIIQQAH